MTIIWIILGIIAVGLLCAYFNSKNSVWGGLTIGIIIGIILAVFPNFTWVVAGKCAIIGTIIGFVADVVSKMNKKIVIDNNE